MLKPRSQFLILIAANSHPDRRAIERTESIGAGPVTPVLLSVMEAIAQAERPDMLLVNDMSRNWVTASDRMRKLALAQSEPTRRTTLKPSAGGMQL